MPLKKQSMSALLMAAMLLLPTIRVHAQDVPPGY